MWICVIYHSNQMFVWRWCPLFQEAQNGRGGRLVPGASFQHTQYTCHASVTAVLLAQTGRSKLVMAGHTS